MGAYADIAERVIAKGSYLAYGPYRVPPHARCGEPCAPVPTQLQVPRSGVSDAAGSWAHESQMDDARAAPGRRSMEIDCATFPTRARNSYALTVAR